MPYRHAVRRFIWSFICFMAGGAVAATPAVPAPIATTLKLATWNLEWLMTPAALNSLKGSCSRGGKERTAARAARSIPCDVVARFERSRTDFAGLARYARKLDADVIALQEVDGARAAALVFAPSDYEFCFTGAHAVQNTGFAIRRGIAYHCGPDVSALSLGDRVRRGAVLTLYPGTRAEMRLLGIHLKAGCARGPLNTARRTTPCRLLTQQVPALESWIDSEARSGTRYAVLGDFNRELLAEQGTTRAADGSQVNVWAEIDDGDPPNARLLNTAAGQPFRNCARGQLYKGFIDYIVLGPGLATALVPASFERLTYTTRDAARLKLSDHCPVAIRLRLS